MNRSGWGKCLALSLLLGATSISSPVALAASKPTYAHKMEMGNLLFFNGDIDRAIAAFEAAAELNPKAFEPHLNLINLYVQKGGDDALAKAEAECQEVIKRKPQNKDVHLILGNLIRNQAGAESDPAKQKARMEEARKEVSTAEELGAPKALCENTQGLILLQEGDTDGALAHIDEALKAQPVFADAHLIKAVLLFKNVNKPKPGEAASTTPVDVKSPEVKAKLDDVLSELDLAIKQKDKNAEAHNTKADILSALGKTDEALDEYNKATKDEPRYVQAWAGVGNCEAALAATEKDQEKQKERIKNARAAYESAKKLKPDDKNIIYGLAVMLEKLGLVGDAIEEFQNGLLLETDPMMKGTIAMHIQQLQQAGAMQLNAGAGGAGSALGGIYGGAGVGNNMFTGGALSIPMKDLIQLKEPAGKKSKAE